MGKQAYEVMTLATGLRPEWQIPEDYFVKDRMTRMWQIASEVRGGLLIAGQGLFAIMPEDKVLKYLGSNACFQLVPDEMSAVDGKVEKVRCNVLLKDLPRKSPEGQDIQIAPLDASGIRINRDSEVKNNHDLWKATIQICGEPVHLYKSFMELKQLSESEKQEWIEIPMRQEADEHREKQQSRVKVDAAMVLANMRRPVARPR